MSQEPKHHSSNTLSETVIKFESVTKRFSFQTQKTLRGFIPALIKGEKIATDFTALNDISFDIKKGESVGIIGSNGSGKSTILKLIAGIMTPTDGQIFVQGRVSPLIDLDAGFHSNFTGRENIYINGALLGLSQKEIDAQFQNILDFSCLQDFIDQPIKKYSSGMYMRLGFSIAIHTHPEILLIDEILSVGDNEFQQKCLKKMKNIQQSGVTIVFVSHNLNQIKEFCPRTLLIDHSKLICDNITFKSCDEYYNLTHQP